MPKPPETRRWIFQLNCNTTDPAQALQIREMLVEIIKIDPSACIQETSAVTPKAADDEPERILS